MTNLKILLKNNLNLLLGRFQGKKQRKSTIAGLCILLLGGIGVFALYSLQAYSMFSGLGQFGLYNLCLFHGFLTSLSCLCIIGVMRVSGSPKNNDDDLLLSLPIKKRDIVISKTLSKYLFDLFFSALLLLPYVILYSIYSVFSISVLLKGLLCVFILPFLSVGISYILDFIITRLFNRLKCGKLLKSLLSVFIFILIMALLLMKTMFYGNVQVENMQAYFTDRYFSNLFLNFVLVNKLSYWLLVLSIIFVPFIIGMILYSYNYGKSFMAYKGTNKILKFNNKYSNFMTLLKKELSTYISITPWIVNSIIGPTMILAFSLILSITGYEKLPFQITNIDYLSKIICVVFCFMICTTLISCLSISLEGKSIWLLKSSPISEKRIFLAKGLLQVLIAQPSLIISTIILSISLKLSILHILIILIIPTLLLLILSFGGVLVNIFYPLFNYEDETKVVKQSFSTLITMVLGIVLMASLVGLYFLFKSLNLVYIFLICSLFLLTLLIVTVSLLMTIGVTKFRKINL